MFIHCKTRNENFMTYVDNVNSQYELFKLSIDMLKCLIFVLGIIAVKDKDIRSRILTMIEPQKISEECQRLINVKRDNPRIEEKNISRVQVIKN